MSGKHATFLCVTISASTRDGSFFEGCAGHSVGAADPGKRKVVFGVFQENGKPIFDRSRTIRKCLDYHATTDVRGMLIYVRTHHVLSQFYFYQNFITIYSSLFTNNVISLLILLLEKASVMHINTYVVCWWSLFTPAPETRPFLLFLQH